MKLNPRFFILCSVLALALAGYTQFVHLGPEQRLLRKGIYHLENVFEPHSSFGTTLEVLRADGLPKEIVGAKIELQIVAPDRLHIATTIQGGRTEFGRDGQQLWAYQPEKQFAVLGSADVPKYAGDPDSIETVKLGPLRLPEMPLQIDTLTRLCTVETLPDEILEGTKCRVLRAKPRPTLDHDGMELTLWLRETDAFPLKVEFADGKNIHAIVALHDVITDPEPDVSLGKLPQEAAPIVKRVALAHLSKFIDTLPDLIHKPKVEPIGPITGEHEVVATHGSGRLERHDGTQVLFLKGTPEEMGEQHGTLLAGQVRDVARRLLYGVGVGSSLAKSAWFFGTIESCQARIGKFVDPRHLREMDALAKAAGLDAEETRLANFFPELFHCSGFALHGSATEGGHLYHGRILDYMVGVGLEQNAVVIVSQPDDAHAWVNISYAGFTGSVTAMNDAKISIGEMGGRGEGNWDGKPMAQLVREVMEKASTLEEAVEIMRSSARTCEYYYVIADGKTMQSVGIKATPEIFEVVHPGEAHPQLSTPVKDTVLLSAGDRYVELARRVAAGYGTFDAESARALMTRPVCMNSNIHSVLFQTDTLDFWVANADSENPASHTRYTHYNLAELLKPRAPQP